MKEIGFTINMVVKVPDRIYEQYIDPKDGLPNLWQLADDYIRWAPRKGVKLSWYEFDYPEIIEEEEDF